ncbi:MAG: 50S ribosomal protein L25 [Microthrixaceae bacterium]
MSDATLTAESGRQTGTSASRRARHDRQLPGVVYGAGKDSIAITVDKKDFRLAMSTEAGINAVIDLQVDGGSDQVIVREVQRHPVRRDVIHVDFMRIDPTRPIELDVPLHLVGEAKKVTVNGGMTEQRLNRIRVRAAADRIPGKIEVDISEMTLERSLLVKDLNLPEGLVCLTSPQLAVVTAELTRAAVVARRAGDTEES